jgi:3-deoxy-D-manno-octulosonic-acid transferase
METEIWPNLFQACRRRGVALILANARLSARSARGYRRAGTLIRESLAAVHSVGAQGVADAARFRELGVPENRVTATGNLKFEASLPDGLLEKAHALRAALGPTPLWLAASTHEGEERIVLRALKDARATEPALRLLLVPRHPERFTPVQRLAEEAGWRVARRSRGWENARDADILLGDSMGELSLFYAASDIAFVGGSLASAGGHNIIEAALCGCPILIGPHTFNMAAVRTVFEEAGALIGVADGAELSRAVARLLRDPEARRGLAERDHTLLSSHRGAKENLLALVGQALR